MAKTYDEQIQQQIEQYRKTNNMHDLPPAFHSWSENAIRPGLQQVFGADDVTAFYVGAFLAAAQHRTGALSFLSLGCGDGTVEIAIVRSLLERGLTKFRFICFDLSSILLERFHSNITEELVPYFDLIEGDLNTSKLDVGFDAVMANHSLHHMVDLEGIFRTVYDALAPGGVFVTSDMVGRNGHMRWPEARLFVDFFWPFLTERQRLNIVLGRVENWFLDHDCSNEGFEGVRSQDVLPLILAQGFHPWKFMSFGGMVDVFVDRCFGPNFNIDEADDAFLARRIGFLNEVLLDAGLIKPTMMLAWFTKDHRHDAACFRNRTAHGALREPAHDPAWLANARADFAHCATDPEFVFRATTPLSEVREVPAALTEQADLVVALRQAQQDLLSARAAEAAQEYRVAALEASTSWQITAPLRLVMKFLKR